MLALSRKKNEAIIISNNIEVTILDVRGDQVKLEFQHPKKYRYIEKRYISRFRMRTRKL